MSQATSNTLFSAEGAALTDPTDVESALAQMWDTAGQGATGKADAHTATRVSVANLIVFGAASDWDPLLEALAELSPMFPTRTIAVLIADREPSPGRITAAVSAICHVPQSGAAQVCCELIVLRAGNAHVDTLPRTLLPLLESDVPVMVWWRLDPAQWPELFATARSRSSRLIVDAGLEGMLGLDSAGHCAVRELGWYRTYPWREFIAQMFDDCGPEAAAGISRVRLQTRGRSSEETIDAAWLAGFLGGQLGWTPSRARVEEPAGPNGPRQTVLELTSRQGPVEVTLVESAGHGCGLSNLVLASGESTFELHCHPGRVEEYRITTSDERVCQVPRSVQVPGMRRSHALAAALAGRRVDAAFDRARPIAAWIAGFRTDQARTGA